MWILFIMKSKFDIYYESVISDLNNLDDLEKEPVQKLCSFEHFRHYLKRI